MPPKRSARRVEPVPVPVAEASPVRTKKLTKKGSTTPASAAKSPKAASPASAKKQKKVKVVASDDADAEVVETAVVDEDVIIASDSDDSIVVLFPDEDSAASDDGVVRLGTTQPDDDESDSSEDEAVLNRIGDIPLEWYKDEEHVGYDIAGERIMKPKQSALDELLDKTDDPNALRTIIDPMTGEKKVLSNKDLALLFNLQRNRVPNPEHKTMYDDEPSQGISFDPLNHPLARSAGPSKKTFVPAWHEMKKIEKMVKRIMKAKEAEDGDAVVEKDDDKDEPYMMWDDAANVEMDAKQKFKYYNSIPKTRVAPPGTYESYRPPPEYLPSADAKKRHERLRRIDRKEHFLPRAFDSLRHVPFYNHFIQDRYQRCLDLAFYPRMTRTRIVVDPKKLLPDLPSPKDLRPYPERLSFLYKGHTGTVRSISVSPNGQYLVTGCDDHLVRVFEIQTGRLMKRYDVGGVVQQVAFCPSKTLNVIAVAVEFAMLFLVPPFCAHETITEHSIRFLRAPGSAPLVDERKAGGVGSGAGRGITQATMDADETAYKGDRDLDDEAEKERRAEFIDANAAERAAGVVVKVVMHARATKFTFHHKGDYLCVLCPKDHVKYRQTIMLQLSSRKVFCPFRKFGEIVTDCAFHPTEPKFFLSTTNSVRCYNLLAHRMQKRYKAQGGLTTCIDVHPLGDNFIVGDTTNHTMWYDCDFSDKPYKRMRSHKAVVNAVGFHKNTEAYPLFATGAADGQVHVFHGMVYEDYTKNALIVPVKILKHTRPVYALAWHPTLPWVFTSTEDGTVCCWTE
jgi:ribosome biogenesis protein ERB1